MPGLVKRDSGVSRFNNLNHGLRSRYEVIQGEDMSEYDAFKAELYEDVKPDGALQKELFDRLVFFLWRLRRAARAEVALVNANIQFDERERINWERMLSSSLIDQVIRYETHAVRQVSRILEEIRKKDLCHSNILKIRAIFIKNTFVNRSNLPMRLTGKLNPWTFLVLNIFIIGTIGLPIIYIY